MITSLSFASNTLSSVRQEERYLTKGHVITARDDNGEILGIRWPYAPNINAMAKQRGASWSGKYWAFPTADAANKMLTVLQTKFDLPVADATKSGPTEEGTEYSVLPISDDQTALLISRELSFYTSLPFDSEVRSLLSENSYWPSPTSSFECQVFHFQTSKIRSGLAILALPDTIKQIVQCMDIAGAIEQPMLAQHLQTQSKVKVSTAKWAVEIRADLSNPLHWPLTIKRSMLKIRDGCAIASTTRSKWSTWQKRIEEAGLDWEGDDPEAEDLSLPVNFDDTRVQGWHTPAPNGFLLHEYQKEGARFCASRGMRALIGDEMGVGKTVQAIAAAEATATPRVIVICPANARYVWEREIQGWGGNGAIQHIENQLETLDLGARWHILTYDLIAARTETWLLNDEAEVSEFVRFFPSFADDPKLNSGEFPRKIKLSEVPVGTPNFNDAGRALKWEKKMRRLRSELLEQILCAGPLLVILDEAHRAKNRDAKRTKAIQRIAEGEAQVLMLTGTPLRNNEHEAAVLLSLIDADASKKLSKKHGYTIQDVKDYLGYFMIRRTKKDVLPELPEKTRQRIDLDKLDEESMIEYRQSLEYAHQLYMDSLTRGESESVARQQMHGGIEMARTSLGKAKVLGGEVCDLVLDVLENKGCCVVFCAHHSASDILKSQLERENVKVAVIDGRVPAKERSNIETDFQDGRLDVVIGGINAAGEAITLTRADTVIFVEFEWVPASLLQAEDRIHRVGQKSNCQVLQLVARLPGENLDEMMINLLTKKMTVIGSVLEEESSNIVASSITAELHSILLSNISSTNEASQADSAHTEEKLRSIKDENKKSLKKNADKAKPKRGRPKLYIYEAPPTSTERSKSSIKSLAAAGGKRVMLRLSPEAYDALKVIMSMTEGTQETASINQAIIARRDELLRSSVENTQPNKAKATKNRS